MDIKTMDTDTVALPKPAVGLSLHGAGERSLSLADGGLVPLRLDEAKKVAGGGGPRGGHFDDAGRSAGQANLIFSTSE